MRRHPGKSCPKDSRVNLWIYFTYWLCHSMFSFFLFPGTPWVISTKFKTKTPVICWRQPVFTERLALKCFAKRSLSGTSQRGECHSLVDKTVWSTLKWSSDQNLSLSNTLCCKRSLEKKVSASFLHSNRNFAVTFTMNVKFSQQGEGKGKKNKNTKYWRKLQTSYNSGPLVVAKIQLMHYLLCCCCQPLKKVRRIWEQGNYNFLFVRTSTC